MTWQLTSFACLVGVLVCGGVWYERTRPSAKIVAMVAALAALAVAGRVVLAPIPNVVATTDIVLFTGYAIGGAPGFAVGALAALVSNFWLGQGPWTPWQMGGWGMVGIGGAVLAGASGRQLGRFGLAFWCGFAGLAYGALLDLSVMVTYGGEQSLDRYLALAARGLPFNIAHAAGNVAFALLAGPALVRMLLRFRERIEVRWQPAPPAIGRGLQAGAGMLLIAVASAAAATAFFSTTAQPARAQEGDGAVGYLERAQNFDGGFGVAPGADSSVGMTAWVSLGLEAAGINPLDFTEAGLSPVDFLRSSAGAIRTPNDLQRTILVLEAAGLDSTGFGGRNLVAELRDQRRSDGSFRSWPNLTAYGILALAAAGEPDASLRRSARWLASVQNDDGGWGAVVGAPSDSDSAGAVAQSLAAAGAGKALDRAVRYLRQVQRADGGWALTESAPTNTQSTAWAVQGLVAGGLNPAGVTRNGRGPIDYLAARQVSDGHFRYSSSSDQTPVWVTAQALLAVNRAAFPLAVVPRSATGGASQGTASSGGGSRASAGSPSAGAAGAGAQPRRQAGNRPEAAGARRNPGDRPAGTNPQPPARGTAQATATAAYAESEPTAAAPDGAAEDDQGSSGKWVAAAFGGGVIALLAGFWWYRRRLP